MRIEHLTDGRAVGGAASFETVNPATQQVLAEVARGGAGRCAARWRSATTARWLSRPAASCRPSSRKGGLAPEYAFKVWGPFLEAPASHAEGYTSVATRL